ncbi:MAG: hypothetical protein J6D54_07580, partial [Olsenella sp.]|nr:hypothetical protein [Olsenella sp.]
SFLTALSLSFNNLMTKKGRTFMTAFAGSIGIIGIAAILALSNGVNNYIAKTEEEALSSYPLTITKSSFDMTQLMGYSMGGSPAAGSSGAGQASSEGPSSGGGRDVIAQQSIMTDMFAQVKNNDLATFKSFLEGGGSGIEPYVNTIQYSYGITPQVFSTNTANGITRLNPSKMSKTLSNGIMGSSLTGGSSMTSFDELVDDRRLLESQMELVHGSWPEAVDECVLVLDRRGGISDYTLYALGFYDTSVMDDMITNALAGKDAVAPEQTRDFTVEDALGMTFSVVPAADLYQKNVEQGTWTDMSSDADYMRARIEQGIHLRVVGIIKPAEGSGTALVREGIAYTHRLTDELMSRAASSEIVREQRERPDVDVFTGKTFEELRKKDGASFDLSQAFTVDEAALANAFSVDMGALDTSSLSGGLDLTSLGDLSSGFDASKIELDSSAMAGVLSEESIAKIMAGAPRFSLEDAGLADAASGLTADQQKALNTGVQKLMAGYGAWAMLHPTEAQADDAMQRYLATDDAKPILAEMNASLGTAAGDIVNQAMQRYMTEQFAP